MAMRWPSRLKILCLFTGRRKKTHLVRKAHIGEWGTAEDIRTGVELLHLDEVQHGIAAVNSAEVMRYLAENRIRLNITPTSNRKLGRVDSYEEHPIKTLYREDRSDN